MPVVNHADARRAWRSGVCYAVRMDAHHGRHGGTPMRVYRLLPEGLSGWQVFRSLDDTLNEVRTIWQEGDDIRIVLELGEMSEAEVDALPEFQGY
jgi:hypothetical protein